MDPTSLFGAGLHVNTRPLVNISRYERSGRFPSLKNDHGWFDLHTENLFE